MKKDMKEAEKLKELLEKADGHPMMKAILAERAAETLATRKAAAHQIVALRHEAEGHGAIQAEIDGMVEKLADMDRERQELEVEISKKRAVLMRTRLDIESDVRAQEKILYETYDPAIDEAIAWFRDRRETLLRKTPDSQTRKTGSNIFTMIKEFVTFSNAGAIRDALAYCLAAIHELESMKLTPAMDAARIEVLKKGIPDTGEMTEIAGEKPFPKINVDPRCLLPSDSEMDWKTGKLMEEFNKVMGR